jgi:cytoskeletal protein CcmA (bactofilin family)
VECYLKELESDSDWSSPPTQETRSFSGGVFTISSTDESKNQITFTVTGLLTVGASTYQRMIRPTIHRVTGGLSAILSEYVLYWGGGESGDSFIANNVTIIGDLYTNGTLEVGYGASIEGDVISGGDVNVAEGGTVSGTIEEEAEPPYGTPSLETSYYDDQLAIAATYPSGNQNYDSRIFSGTTYVNGAVTFNNDAIITLTSPATLVVTGTVDLKNNVVIGDFFDVIAGGEIDMANNVIIGQSGLWYSSIAIKVGNNAEVSDVDVGEGTVFITPGDITFGNNIEYYGFIFCGGDFVQTGTNFYFEGNMMVGGDINVDENTTLVLNPDLVNEEDLVGIVGPAEATALLEVSAWDEVY